MKSKRRRTIRIVGSLLAGAIINVAVAWACAMWIDIASANIVAAYERRGYPGESESCRAICLSRVGASQIVRHYSRFSGQMISFGPQERELMTAMAYAMDFAAKGPVEPLPMGNLDQWILEVKAAESETGSKGWRFAWALIDARGMPLRSMYSNHERASPPAIWQLRNDSSGVRLDVWTTLSTPLASPEKALPLGILWPDFAINTIFYAAVLWVLFAVPGAVRRRVRIKRGQCASCGYSLRESVSEKCPECGATLKQKAETQKAEMR